MNQDLTQALAERVAAAQAEGRPLRIQGGGTKTWLGRAVAGEPLAVGGHRGILSYEPTELVITARAGTPLAEIEAALAERGQWLAFEPPHLSPAIGLADGSLDIGAIVSTRSSASAGDNANANTNANANANANASANASADANLDAGGSAYANAGGMPGMATLGGTIACGLSGPARPYAGAARDFVLGVRLINGKGEVLRFGGEVMKNVAGYDLSRLMAGAQGTLGVLLEVSLKVLPRPVAELTLIFELSPAEAIRRFNDWAGQPLPLSAACHDGERAYIRLAGNEAAVRAARLQLGGEVLDDRMLAGMAMPGAAAKDMTAKDKAGAVAQGMTVKAMAGAATQEMAEAAAAHAPTAEVATRRGSESGMAADQEAEYGARSADRDFWRGVRELRHPFFQAGSAPLWRLSLPPTAPLDPRLGSQFIDWGGAQRWVHSEHPLWPVAQAAGGHASCYGLRFGRVARAVSVAANLDPSLDPAVSTADAVNAEQAARAVSPGSGEREPAAIPEAEVFQPLPPALLALHRRLKAALDPRGILNPGRIYPEL